MGGHDIHIHHEGCWKHGGAWGFKAVQWPKQYSTPARPRGKRKGCYLDTGWKTTRSSSLWGKDWCREPPHCCVLRQLSLVPGRTLQCSTLSLCYWGRCTSHSQAAPSTVHRFLIQNNFELHDKSIKESDFYYQAELNASGKCYKKKDIKMSSVVNRNILHKYLAGTNNSSYTCIYAHINMYMCIHNTCHEQREDKLNWMLKGKIRKHGNHNPGKRKIRQHLKIPECLPIMGQQGTDPESW